MKDAKGDAFYLLLEELKILLQTPNLLWAQVCCSIVTLLVLTISLTLSSLLIILTIHSLSAFESGYLIRHMPANTYR